MSDHTTVLGACWVLYRVTCQQATPCQCVHKPNRCLPMAAYQDGLHSGLCCCTASTEVATVDSVCVLLVALFRMVGCP